MALYVTGMGGEDTFEPEMPPEVWTSFARAKNACLALMDGLLENWDEVLGGLDESDAGDRGEIATTTLNQQEVETARAELELASPGTFHSTAAGWQFWILEAEEGEALMTDELKVRTNNIPRFTLEPYELTPAERAEFDYLDWAALERGEDSASFIRYKGTTYDLGEFQTTSSLPDFNELRKWDGYHSDSFFSGIVVRYAGENLEEVVVGTFFA